MRTMAVVTAGPCRSAQAGGRGRRRGRGSGLAAGVGPAGPVAGVAGGNVGAAAGVVSGTCSAASPRRWAWLVQRQREWRQQGGRKCWPALASLRGR